MKAFKAMVLCAMVLAAAGLFANGGGDKAVSAAPSSTADNVNAPGVFPIVKNPITIQVGIMQLPNVEDFDTNKLTRWYEQQGNFDLAFEIFPTNGAEARQKVELTMASGSPLPEVLIGFGFSEEAMLNMGLEGVALPLNKYYDTLSYYINERLPELKNKDFKEWLASADGNIYYIPKSNEQIGNMYRLRSWINKTWLDKLGLAMPKTTDDFRAVLQAFSSRDPNGNGQKDEIGFIGGSTGWGAQAASWVMNAFIYDDNVQRYLVDANGKVDVAFNKVEWRDGLRYVNGLIRDGLMLPQSFTMLDAQMRQLAEGGDVSQVGVITHGNAAAVFGATNRRKLEYVPLPPLTGPKGHSTVAFSPDVPQKNMIITKYAKNPEAIFRWGDLMCSEEGYMRTRYGEPVVDWSVPGPNDKSMLESEGIKAKMIPILPWGSVQNSHWSFVTAGIVPSMWSDGQVAPEDPLYSERMIYASVPFYIRKEPAVRVDLQKFTLPEAEELRDIRNAINTYVNESMALFAVGDRDIERDWDGYIRELDTMGLARYLELSQSGYDRAIGKK